ncbi:MAG: IS200/IS605 family accessory protein TnpB-related protein [Spirochaetota bacterium]
MITIFSNRIYKRALNTSDEIDIEQETYKYNRAKWYLIKLLTKEYNEELCILKDPSLHVFTKKKFGFNDYFTNSVIIDARAALSSRIELQQIETAELKERIGVKQKKIDELQRELDGKRAMLQSCVKISKASKQDKPKKKDLKLKTYKGCRERQLPSGLYAVTYKKYTRVFYNLYDFEHQYLRPEIKRLKNIISQIKHSINLMENKLERMESFLLGITFGAKKLFRAQFTKYPNNHEKWKAGWRKARLKSFKIVGRGDAKFGNFVFKYHPETKTLHIILSEKTVTIKNVYFPYGRELLEAALNTRTPLTWEITDHGEYYIFKAMFALPQKERNYCADDGVVGYDKNYDHIAWVETDGKGNFLRYGKIPFYLEGKATGQVNKILEAAAIGLVKIAREARKPLVGEELDTRNSKARLAYGNKVRNRKITQFAYQKMDRSIESRANKEGVGVIRKDPAYTSVIGKLKYMRAFGIPIHSAASYVIGRRGMGLKEKVPAAYRKTIPEANIKKHHWSHWRFLHRHLKGIQTKDFYWLTLNKQVFLSIKGVKAALKA